MTTPQAPGAPEGGQLSGDQPAPGAQEQAPQPQEPQNRPLGKPNAQQAPGAPAKPEAEPAKDDPQDVASLPEWAQKALKKARADAGNARTTAKQQAADEARTQLMAEISKTLGLNTDGEPTVEDLAKQLEERQARIEELEASQTENAYRDLVRSTATEVNADADALLDSKGFRDAVQDELNDEFTDAELAAAVKKIAADYAKKPRFAKQQATPARSGGEIAGPPAPAKQRSRSLNAAVAGAYRRGG